MRLTLIAVCVVTFTLTTIYCQIGISKCKPLYYEENEVLVKELYSKIREHGELPEVQDLSWQSQEIIATDNGITYSPLEGLTFVYDKAYPLNTTLKNMLSWGGCHEGPHLEERSHTPETLRLNAVLTSEVR